MISEKLGDRYELMEELGQTAISTLFKARDLIEQKDVAVRLLKEEFTYDSAIMEAFIKRTSAIHEIVNRKYIAEVYSSSSSAGKVFAVREYVEGISLRQKLDLAGGKLGMSEIRDIGSMVCEALHAAHLKNVIHGGLNPDNVIIATDGKIKITDFGVSTLTLLPEIDENALPFESLPILRYAAPEQFGEGKKEDTRTDIYQVGILLHELLMGETPFSGPSFMEYKNGHCEGSIPQQPEAIRRSLQKNPADRFQEARELESALDAITELPPIPILHISPEKFDLGNVEKGKACPPVRFSVSNRGGGKLKGRIATDPLAGMGMHINPVEFELDAPMHQSESDPGLFIKGVEVQVEIDTSMLQTGPLQLQVVVITQLGERKVPIRLQCVEPAEKKERPEREEPSKPSHPPIYMAILQSLSEFTKALLYSMAFRVVLVAAFIGICAWVGYGVYLREALKKQACVTAAQLMDEGEYVQAKAMLDGVVGSSNEVENLKQLLTKPLSAKIEMFLPQGKHQGAEPALIPSGGEYRFEVALSADAYLYLFQQDSQGNLEMLFPNPKYNHIANPLRAGKSYNLPSREIKPEDELNKNGVLWFYLDNTPGEEEILLVASLRPAKDLEKLFNVYVAAGNDQEKALSLGKLRERINSRKEILGSGVKCLDYSGIRLIHE